MSPYNDWLGSWTVRGRDRDSLLFGRQFMAAAGRDDAMVKQANLESKFKELDVFARLLASLRLGRRHSSQGR